MKRFFNIQTLGSIASIVALLLFIFYQFFVKENVELELKTINREKLTEIPIDQNLSVKYSFKGRPVKNLYKVRFSIRNSGTKTLIGDGEQKNIIGENIPVPIDSFEFRNVLFIEKITSNFPNTVIIDSLNNLKINFKQWRANEFIEISAYIESTNGSKIHNYKIDDRNLIDGTVLYSEYSPAEKSHNRKLIDLLPKGLTKIIWWGAIFAIGVLFLLSIYSILKEFKKPDLNGIAFKIILIIAWGFITFFAMAPLLWMINV